MERPSLFAEWLAKPILNLGVRSVVSIVYEFALAALVPLSTLLLTPGFEISLSYVKAAGGALGIMLACFIVLLVFKKRLHSALISLGIMTLVPGILAIIVSATNPATLFNLAAERFVGFERVGPLLQNYLEHAVPQVTLVGLLYALIGVLLVASGVHLRVTQQHR